MYYHYCVTEEGDEGAGENMAARGVAIRLQQPRAYAKNTHTYTHTHTHTHTTTFNSIGSRSFPMIQVAVDIHGRQ